MGNAGLLGITAPRSPSALEPRVSGDACDGGADSGWQGVDSPGGWPLIGSRDTSPVPGLADVAGGSPGLCVSGQSGRWTRAGARAELDIRLEVGGLEPTSPCANVGGGPTHPMEPPPRARGRRQGRWQRGWQLGRPHSLGQVLRPSVSMLTAPAWAVGRCGLPSPGLDAVGIHQARALSQL